MERREFVQLGALSALSALGSQAVARTIMDPTRDPSRDPMAAFLDKLDSDRRWINDAPLDGLFAAIGSKSPLVPEQERLYDLVRKATRSLYLSRAFRALPEVGQAHPGMQGRILSALPEMNDAVREARRYLLGLSAADKLDLQEAIRREPELLLRLSRYLTERAGEAGLEKGSRELLRRQMEHLDLQMRRSSAGVIIDRYVAQADQASGQAADQAAKSLPQMIQRLQDRLGASAFVSLQTQNRELARSWWEDPPPGEYPGAGEVYRMGVEPTDALEAAAKRRKLLIAGAAVFGVGVVPTGVGLAFVPFTVGLSAIAATPGLGMMITGIALMAVGSRKR